MSKTIVVGDVHGCIHTLKKLIRKFPKNSSIIFLGDLCNKGKYSKDVIDYVIKNNHQCLLGNHEMKLYRDFRTILYSDKKKHISYEDSILGSSLSIQSYQKTFKARKKMKQHLNWIESLPLYMELKVNNKKIFLTHGFGLPYYERKDNFKYAKALYLNKYYDESYKKEWEDYSKYRVVNIFGHSVFNDVLKEKNFIGIDTGCVNGNKLSAIDLETFKIYSQKVDSKDLIKESKEIKCI